MKKTILAIALAAASTVAFATGGETTSVSTYSGAAVGGSVGSAVVGNGGGFAIMGSEASAYNYSAASADADKTGWCDPGVEASTSAVSIGGVSSTSWGLTMGNAGGFNSGQAYTEGFAGAQASKYGPNESVSVGSRAGMEAGAGTAVWGTGFSTQSSMAGAFNKSGAEANGNDGLTFWGIPGNAGGEIQAGSLGGSFSGSAGLSVGNAGGGTGAIAGQDGYANASAGGTVYKLSGWSVKPVGGASVSGGVNTGSVSQTEVIGTGIAGTAAIGGGLIGGSASLTTNGKTLATSNVNVYDIKGAATIGGHAGWASDASAVEANVYASGVSTTY